jgi:hypothetical protein
VDARCPTSKGRGKRAFVSLSKTACQLILGEHKKKKRKERKIMMTADARLPQTAGNSGIRRKTCGKGREACGKLRESNTSHPTLLSSQANSVRGRS